MHNLGNTCFQSAILQCLINCVPLQKYFLGEVGHHHLSCQTYRTMELPKPAATTEIGSTSAPMSADVPSDCARKKSDDVCLACEMDKLFLKYFGSTLGVDVSSVISDVSRCHREDGYIVTGNKSDVDTDCAKGEPLITADMLAAAWKCGGMDHLAGYEQRDAHEFLHGFLDVLGKHTRQYRERVYNTINMARPGNAFVSVDNFTDQGKYSVL
jgi:ubiquitin carboxyl-terminal hydrolase 22/27/51